MNKKKRRRQVRSNLEIYIDGSCRKDKYGTYGVLVVYPDGTQTVIHGDEENTTNNIMEMRALIAALDHIRELKLDETYDITIYCDSQYVVKGLTEWWGKWKANGYRSSTGLPIKNLDLWKQLVGVSKKVKATLKWVKGHANNEKHNEIDSIVFALSERKETVTI